MLPGSVDPSPPSQARGQGGSPGPGAGARRGASALDGRARGATSAGPGTAGPFIVPPPDALAPGPRGRPGKQRPRPRRQGEQGAASRTPGSCHHGRRASGPGRSGSPHGGPRGPERGPPRRRLPAPPRPRPQPEMGALGPGPHSIPPPPPPATAAFRPPPPRQPGLQPGNVIQPLPEA